jgi:anaerobic ribonucleoside-triphosphate reductase
MATKVIIEMFLSDTAMNAAKAHKVNIPRIACEAVYDMLRLKIETDRALELQRNADLREQVRDLQEQLNNIHVPVLYPSLKR